MRTVGSVVQANSSARTGKAAKPRSNSGRRPRNLRLASRPRRHQGYDHLRDDDQCGHDDRGEWYPAVHEQLAGKRQHRRIGELEQEHAGGKYKQAAVGPKAQAPCSRRRARPVMIRDPAGAAEVNVWRLDAAQSKEQRQNQCGVGQEDRAIRQEVTDEAHEAGRQNASRRRETLIAPEAFAQRIVADEPKADGNDRQPQKPAGDPLENQSGQHQREARPKRDDERACCHHEGTQGDQISLRADSIEQFPGGQLGQQSGEPRRRQHEADVLLGPFLLCQKHGEVGTEARQRSGEKQIDGIEAAQALTRRRSFNRTRYPSRIQSHGHCSASGRTATRPHRSAMLPDSAMLILSTASGFPFSTLKSVSLPSRQKRISKRRRPSRRSDSVTSGSQSGSAGST